MLKPFLCIIIVFSSTILGFYYSNRLYRRKEILGCFITNLKDAQTQIRYESKSLCHIFSDKFSEYQFSEDKSFFSQWVELLKQYDRILTKKDTELLLAFAKNLGKTDVNGEISHIQMYLELLTSSVEDAKNMIISKSKLYRTLGLSFGLLISILLL